MDMVQPTFTTQNLTSNTLKISLKVCLKQLFYQPWVGDESKKINKMTPKVLFT